MTVAEIVEMLLPEIRSEAELKVLLAVASAATEGKAVDLSLTDLTQRTGLSRQGVINGIELGMKRGVLQRQPSGNSYAYWLKSVHGVDQNGQPRRPKVVNQVDRNSQQDRPEVVNEVDQQGGKSLHEVDHFEKAIHIPDFKDRKNERASVPADEAFQTVARVVKSEVGFLSRRGFDFDAAVSRWGDLLPDVWEFCFRAPNRKPDDLPIYRFEDACNRKFDTGLVPKQRETSAIVAPPPGNPSFERFEQVQTPRGDTWTIVDIAPNGLVAFEETDEIWFARDLTPLRVAAA